MASYSELVRRSVVLGSVVVGFALTITACSSDGDPPPTAASYLPALEAVCADTGEAYDEVDITTDPELMEQYAEQIPVTLVDGKQHDYWRVDAARLRTALS